MTSKHKNGKMVIWDFDGVIADSEKLWVSVWLEELPKEKGIVLTEKEKDDLLVGVADRTKKKNLEAYFPGLVLDDDFMRKIDEGERYKGTHFMRPIEGVEEVMKALADNGVDQCIATGATHEQHTWKMTQFGWIEKYMSPADYFTVDMVEHGKPAPDLFNLASSTKGYAPKDCIVIGDSLNDIKAAKAAGMPCIAFVGAEGNNTSAYREQCRQEGAVRVCATMKDVQKALQDLTGSNRLPQRRSSYSR